MEEIKQAVATISDVYERISDLLRSTNPQDSSATDDMLKDSEGVKRYADGVITTNQFTDSELNLVLGVEKRFGRHLSEVEQTVYEEIGNEKLDQLRSFMKRDSDAYDSIYSYLKENETN